MVALLFALTNVVMLITVEDAIASSNLTNKFSDESIQQSRDLKVVSQ